MESATQMLPDAHPGLPNMLSQCANSNCGKRFLKLREGKLFLVQIQNASRSGKPASARNRQQHAVEYYWLCDECALQWTLMTDAASGIVLSPLPQPMMAPSAAAVQSGLA